MSSGGDPGRLFLKLWLCTFEWSLLFGKSPLYLRQGFGVSFIVYANNVLMLDYDSDIMTHIS